MINYMSFNISIWRHIGIPYSQESASISIPKNNQEEDTIFFNFFKYLENYYYIKAESAWSDRSY